MTTPLAPVLPTRTEIYGRLRADAALTAIVGQRIYLGKLPHTRAFPFVTVPLPASEPRRYDGGPGGADLSGLVHCFTAPSAALPGAEKAAATINAHVVRILREVDTLIVDGAALSITAGQAQVMRDPHEADGWHGVVRYQAAAT